MKINDVVAYNGFGMDSTCYLLVEISSIMIQQVYAHK